MTLRAGRVVCRCRFGHKPSLWLGQACHGAFLRGKAPVIRSPLGPCRVMAEAVGILNLWIVTPNHIRDVANYVIALAEQGERHALFGNLRSDA